MKNFAKSLSAAVLGLITTAAMVRAQGALAASATNFSAFKIIADQNIFDPNRVPHQPGQAPRKVSHVDSFALVGTMDYEKGKYAFFAGSDAKYQKTLKLLDNIANYRVVEINPKDVKLEGASNQFLTLPVGMQMKRLDQGPWTMSQSSGSFASNSRRDSYRSESFGGSGRRRESGGYSGETSSSSSSSSASASPPLSSGAEADIIAKLKAKREQEK